MNDKLSPYLAERILKDAEREVIKLSTESQELEPQVKEYREAYLKLQYQYDTINDRLKQEKELVEWASKQKNGLPQHKKILVMRPTSHNEMRENEKTRIRGKQKTHFTWTTYAVSILQERDVMLSKDELWDAILDKYNVVETFRQIDPNGHIGKLRWGAINASIGANAESTKRGGKRGVVFEYKGYFGLKEWAGEDFRPKGIYASRFHQKIV
jgi:hypothetical protein